MLKLRDAIYGFAVGDALGVPYEFKNRGTFCCTDMIGFGTWKQPAGTWSDDTSMTLATCDSIRECGKVDVEDLMKRFSRWYYDAEYTADNKVFDIGGTTREAIENYKYGRPAIDCGIDDYNANGNGSLMRILPLAFIDCTFGDAEKVSTITHAHYISMKACVMYAGIATALRLGMTLKQALQIWLKGQQEPFDRLAYLTEIPEREIKSTGYVIHTLEAALWCLMNTYNYKDAVLKAVNLGGDTDTIAAVTGGIAGMMYGYDSIPEEWIFKLKNKELIEKCLFKD